MLLKSVDNRCVHQNLIDATFIYDSRRALKIALYFHDMKISPIRGQHQQSTDIEGLIHGVWWYRCCQQRIEARDYLYYWMFKFIIEYFDVVSKLSCARGIV